MPIVAESYSQPPVTYKVRRNGSQRSVTTAPLLKKTQTGFRSGKRVGPEKDNPQNGQNWFEASAFINSGGYDYLQRKSRTFMVNDRDASKTLVVPLHRPWSVQFRNRNTGQIDAQSGVGLIVLGTHNSGLPGYLSETSASAHAGELLRASVPTQPQVDIARTLGEAFEWRKMFDLSSYQPASSKEAGGSFLNIVFGVEPTIKDLKAICLAIRDSDSIIRDYISHERRALRRNRSRVITNSSTYDPNIRSTAFGNVLVASNYGFSAYSYDYAPEALTYYGFALDFNFHTRIHQRISSFATFEYFIPKPSGIEDRLKRYKQLASKVIGSGVEPSTVWELTSYSWLIDWFVDIGGLLRYQQAVANNNVVASRTGYSQVFSYDAFIQCNGLVRTSNTVWDIVTQDFGGVASCHTTVSKRRKGSPYSISPTWSLNLQQWAILGALGLARGPEVRI